MGAIDVTKKTMSTANQEVLLQAHFVGWFARCNSALRRRGVRPLADGARVGEPMRNAREMRAHDFAVYMSSVLDNFRTSPSTSGWERVLAHLGEEWTWEWLVIDPDAPWASLFTDTQRDNVIVRTAEVAAQL